MKSRPISVISMICGILGIIGFWITTSITATATAEAAVKGTGAPVIAVVFAVLFFIIALAGIVLGAMGIKKSKAEGRAKGFAVAGLVCGIIGTFFAIIGLACAACIVANWDAQAISNAVYTDSSLSSSLDELSSLLS